MPTVAEVKLAALIAAATSSLATATTNSVAATAATDAAYSAIVAAVHAGGHDSFEVGANSVTVPARLRSWSAEGGVSAPQRTDIGLNALVSTWRAASAAALKRQNELAGLEYVLGEARGLAAEYPPVVEEDVLPSLQAMLTEIQTSMAS